VQTPRESCTQQRQGRTDVPYAAHSHRRTMPGRTQAWHNDALAPHPPPYHHLTAPRQRHERPNGRRRSQTRDLRRTESRWRVERRARRTSGGRPRREAGTSPATPHSNQREGMMAQACTPQSTASTHARQRTPTQAVRQRIAHSRLDAHARHSPITIPSTAPMPTMVE
jgi:hypothetical protein